MSTTLEPSELQDQSSGRNENQLQSQSTTAVDRMRTTMAASRVSFTWFGTTKSLSEEQKTTAAQSFGAEGGVLSAGKKLIDTRHPAYKEVTSVKSRIVAFWKGETLAYPLAGVRLIRQDRLGEFDTRLREFRDELDESVLRLDAEYLELKAAARDRLGELFDSADYPATLTGLFHVEWTFPSVEPPDYLRQLNPQLYRQEAERVARRFDEALEMAEAAFIEELSQLIGHLTERLSGQSDGKPKIFRDTAVTNLSEFFVRFRQLNVRSNLELDDLVATCQQVVQGRTPQSLRENRLIRDTVTSELNEVGQQLDQLLVDRPRRNLIRKAR